MCILFVALNLHSKYKLVIASNRDEDKTRPSKAAEFWSDHGHILGGRDLVQHGTWLAVSKKGKIGALTNLWIKAKLQNTKDWKGEQGKPEHTTCDVPGFKAQAKHPLDHDDGKLASPKKVKLGSPVPEVPGEEENSGDKTKYLEETAEAPTRGNLIKDYLTGDHDAERYMNAIVEQADLFNGFNLLLFEFPVDGNSKEATCYYLNNTAKDVKRLSPGTFGVSNSHLNDWPKVQHGLEIFQDILNQHQSSSLSEEKLVEELLALMSNKQQHETGGSKKDTSSIFVDTVAAGSPYGTRTQTIILVDHDNRVSFTERNLDTETGEWVDQVYEFPLEQA